MSCVHDRYAQRASFRVWKFVCYGTARPIRLSRWAPLSFCSWAWCTVPSLRASWSPMLASAGCAKSLDSGRSAIRESHPLTVTPNVAWQPPSGTSNNASAESRRHAQVGNANPVVHERHTFRRINAFLPHKHTRVLRFEPILRTLRRSEPLRKLQGKHCKLRRQLNFMNKHSCTSTSASCAGTGICKVRRGHQTTLIGVNDQTQSWHATTGTINAADP